MADSLGQMVVKIVGDNAVFDKSVDASERKFVAFGEKAAKIGKSLTTFVTLPILGIGLAAVKSAADMEMQEAAFTTMLGSAKAATTMLGNLKDLAAKTPFQLTDLADGTKTLLGFGVAAEDILPTIRRLGDISQGNSQRFQSLSLAFAQVQATGRLMGQDLLQMINSGFNPLQQISEDTGQSMADLKDAMEDGAISADVVAEAFAHATEEGGRFFEGMERASQTLAGQFSTLKDNVAELGRSFAGILLPPLKNIISSMTQFTQRFSNLGDSTKTYILAVLGVTAAIGPLMFGIGKLIPVVIALNKAVLANPWVAVAAAVAAVSIALGGLIVANRDAKRAQEEANTAAQEAADLTREQRIESGQSAIVSRERAIALLEESAQTDGVRENIKRLKEEIESYNNVIAENATREEMLARGRETILAGIDAKRASIAKLEAFAKVEGKSASYYSAIANSVDRLTQELDGYTTALERQEKAIADLNAGTDDGTTTLTRYQVAVQNVAAGFVKVAADARLAADTNQEFNETEAKQKIVLDEIAKNREEGFKVENANIQTLIKRYADLFAVKKDGIRVVRQGSEAEREYTEAAISGATEQQSALEALWTAEKEAAATRKREHQAELDRIKAERDARISYARDVAIQVSAFARQLADNRITELRRVTDAQVIANNAELERMDATLKFNLDNLDKELQAELQRLGVAELTKTEKLQAELAAAKEAGDAEKVLELEKVLKREEITAQYEERRQKIIEDAEAARVAAAIKFDEEIAANRREIARKEAVANKATALFDIALNTAVAISKVMPNIGAMIASAALGALQATVVASKPLPALAEGGIAMPRPGGVVANIAERGQPEIVSPLDRLGEVLTAYQSSRMEDGDDIERGDIHLQVNLDSRPILQTIFPATRNRTVLIDARAVVSG